MIIRHFGFNVTWKFPYNEDVMLKCNSTIGKYIEISPYINNMYILSGIANISICDSEDVRCIKIPGINISNTKIVLKDGTIIIYEEIKDYIGITIIYYVLSFL